MESEGAAPAASATSSSSGSQLIKRLATCNKQTRDRALKVILRTWLPSGADISEEEMRKLWKGLFYCVWHSDKAAVQSELIGRLSSALVSLPLLPLALRYFSSFFLTMRREWAGIDHLRLDKFYLLIRRFLHSSFLMLKKNYSWDLDTTSQFMAVLEKKTFFPDDKFQANGVNYHIAGVFLEELTFFLPLRAEILDVMLKPFMSVMSKCQDKVLVGKVKANVFDVLLKMGRSLLEMRISAADSSVDNKVALLGPIGLTMGLSTKFYNLSTSPDCLQGNRKVLLRLFEDFLRLEKDLATSGIEISIPDAVVDAEEEVPMLIPITSETEENGSSNVSSKKTKKAKKGELLDKGNKKADQGDKKAKKKNKKKKKDKSSVVIANGEHTSNENSSDEPKIIFTESVISNLQKQFEKVAAEVAMENDGSSLHSPTEVTVEASRPKKRKRVKSAKREDKVDFNGENGNTIIGEKSSEKSAKKVRFEMRSNVVWKPHSPMPPLSLRLPPSVTPKGSALKKGVPPGPIREMPTNKAKQLIRKKGRKVNKTLSPAVKRLRKLQTISV